MNEIKAWAQPLQVPRKTYANWREIAPEDVDFTYWCLETGKLNEEEYLDWARDHYGLASITEDFFETSPDLVLWKRVMKKGKWNEALLPVGEWEGVVFVACVEPPEGLQFGFPVRFLLASASSLSVAWESLQRSSLPPSPHHNLTEAIPTAKIVIEPPSAPRAEAVPSIPTHPKTAKLKITQEDEVSVEDLGSNQDEVSDEIAVEVEAQGPAEEKSMFPELPPEPEKEEDMIEGLDPKLIASIKEAPVEDDEASEFQTKTTHDADILKGMPTVGGDGRIELPEPHGFTLSASLNKYLLHKETQTTSGPNVVQLDTTAGTAMPQEEEFAAPQAAAKPHAPVIHAPAAVANSIDADNEVTGDIAEAVAAMQAEPARPAPVVVPPPPSSQASAVEDSEYEGHDLPTAIIRNAKLKQEEARRALAAEQGVAPEATSAASEAGPNEPTATEMVAPAHPAVSAVVCDLPPPPASLASAKDEKEVAAYVFSQLHDRFEKSMILLFEGTKLRPWMWDAPWVATLPTAADAFDVSNACVFRIVRRTRLSYHGMVVKNEINENFFRSWGYADLPAHVTICPIQYDSHLVGMVLAVGNKNCDTTQHLSYAERLTQQLSEAMQKVNSSAA